MKKIYAYFLFFVFFLLFPFGQLLRTDVSFFGKVFVIHAVDLVASLSLPFLFIIKGGKTSKILKVFIFIIFSSFIFSTIIFKPIEIFTGFLYLMRIVSYFSFYILIYYLSESKKLKNILLCTIFYSILVFTILGWIQYIYYYDLRDLIYLGWDDHYYRLTSTLLDPGYTAAVIIIGLIIILRSNLIQQKLLKYLSILLFTMSIALTYSRAGYLSLIMVFLYIFGRKRKILILLTLLFTVVIVLLPKPSSSGVELTRTFSIFSRINDYGNTLKIFSLNPLFGIGFNNICQYKVSLLDIDNYFSHSCSGSDSSIFLLLATTGVIGFIVFINCIYKIGKYLKGGLYDILLKTVFLSIIVGSFFNNILFYNFIMGLMAVFLGLTRKLSIQTSRELRADSPEVKRSSDQTL